MEAVTSGGSIRAELLEQPVGDCTFKSSGGGITVVFDEKVNVDVDVRTSGGRVSSDLPVTTDFRRVFSELLIRRMGNNKLGNVFPGYSAYSPLGIFQGTDIAPQYVATGDTQIMANLPANPQPVFGESIGESSRAVRASAAFAGML